MNNYYVYLYLDPRKPGNFNYGIYHFDFEPFYVGKGKDKRLFKHLTSYVLSNDISYKTNKIKAILNEDLEPIIIKYRKKLLECQAFKLEIDLIKFIGRIDLGTGPLTNLTDGGDGTSGHIHIVSEKTKLKLSKINKGKKLSKETKRKIGLSLKGRIVSKETRKKISKINKGKKLSEKTKKLIGSYHKNKIVSEETKKKISNSTKGKIVSEETINKRNKLIIGQKRSKESKLKMSKSHKGKIFSEETKKKMSESAAKSWKKRKLNKNIKGEVK